MTVRRSVLMFELLALGLIALPAAAEELPPVEVTSPDLQKGQAGKTDATKPEVIIGGQPVPPRSVARCGDGEAGGARGYGCLNDALKRGVDKVNPTANVAPIDARSGDTKTGVVNIPGVQQQYGQNFGRSVVPFRPPQPTFNGVPRR